MMRRRTFIWLIALLLGGLLPVTSALAASDSPDDGVVLWNEDYTLAEGEQLDGGLVVFNGDVTLAIYSRVEGDVVIWNGGADVEGTIRGDLVASNGDIHLGGNARVTGDVVCIWNCNIERGEGAQVEGSIVEGISLRGFQLGRWRGLTRPSIEMTGGSPFWLWGPRHALAWLLKVIRGMITILVIAVMGGLAALIWPEATAQVGRTVFKSPGPSLGIGLLTIVAATALIIALTITICFSPVAALIALALAAAGLFGWVAIGARVGERLLQGIDLGETGEVAPLWAAGLGTLLITLVSVGLSAALCLAPLGWLLILTLGSLGLGAVVLTRFGTTPYIPG